MTQRGGQASGTINDLTGLRMRTELPFSHSIKSLFYWLHAGQGRREECSSFCYCLTSEATHRVCNLGKVQERPTGDMAASTTKAVVPEESIAKATRGPRRSHRCLPLVGPGIRFHALPPKWRSGMQTYPGHTMRKTHPSRSAKLDAFSSSSSPKDVLRTHLGAVDQTIADWAAIRSMSEISTYEGADHSGYHSWAI